LRRWYRVGETEEVAPEAVGEGDAPPLRVDQLACRQLRWGEVPQDAAAVWGGEVSKRSSSVGERIAVT